MDWESDKRVARTMLRNRDTRRKIMARMLLLALAFMACGLWLLDDWLKVRPWMFLIWWGACAFLTCMTMVMAVYDMLAVIREEREKHH
jgi:peptidoglycan biosynthesis protein MviN/MurJ (putative lipid II flippase)